MQAYSITQKPIRANVSREEQVSDVQLKVVSHKAEPIQLGA